jgi:predicted nucleic acid binding AN1-type Zn finger protein
MQVEYDDENVCMMPHCTQVDLLLSRCGDCRKKFCQAHLTYTAHNCPSHRDAALLTCPLCNRIVPCNPQEDPNVMVSQHMDRGCRDIPVSSPKVDQQRLNFCSFHSCNKNELTLIVCDKCGNSFCVDHRMPSRHMCTGGSRTPPRVSPTARRSPGKDSTMFRNTPETAIGSYKGDDALVVRVVFPREFRVRPFFFKGGANVVMGRVLDQICAAADVPNVNNASLEDQWRVLSLRGGDASGPLPLGDAFGAVAAGGPHITLVVCKQDTVPESLLLEMKQASTHHDGKSCSVM